MPASFTFWLAERLSTPASPSAIGTRSPTAKRRYPCHPMPILLLIRHAMTDVTGKRLIGLTPGVHLSERGRQQAEALADRLSRVPIAALYTSPLERCRETAEPLATRKGLSMEVVEGLGETDTGDWTGRSLAQLARTKAWRSVHQAPSTFRFPGGESLLECHDRVVEAVSNLVAGHPREIVA